MPKNRIHTYEEGDIVYLKDPPPLPDGTINDGHPVLIVSNNISNRHEGYYTGVMISATSHKDKYSFPLDARSTSRALKPGSACRLHIVISFREEAIKSWANELNPGVLKSVRQRFIDLVLS